MSDAVEFEHVSFTHSGGRPVLRDLMLSVPVGQSLALLGRSGSGKTTVLKLINRLLEPTEGEVRVEGVATRIWDPIRLRRRVGYVLQEIGLFPHLTVAENVAVVPQLEAWPAARVTHRVDELLDMLGLPPQEFGRRYPRELSGGQRQRVGIARALAADPPVLLMDEPFGALDPITRAELQHEFKELLAQIRKTVVLVTHDVPEACLLGSKIGLLDRGRLVECLAPADFLRSAHPEVQAILRTLQLTGARA